MQMVQATTQHGRVARLPEWYRRELNTSAIDRHQDLQQGTTTLEAE